MTESLHVGQVAMMLGIPRRRVQWWIERGFLRVEPDPAYRRGHYFRVTDEELRVAGVVVEFQALVGSRASDQLFAAVRSGAITHALVDQMRKAAEDAAPTLPTPETACPGS